MEVQEENKEKNQDRFTSFMFGPDRDHQESNHNHKDSPANPPAIDYVELMVTIDSLMESVRNLKPLVENIYPFLKQIWKKK
ncbi:MAG: hypothetical protein K6T88_22625 [Bacillus sp. (in: Bacteria)]|nr:hypothetical protein [Bacillus sp. (in: firmicutes)]